MVVRELARPDIVWSCLDNEEVRVVVMMTQELGGVPPFLVNQIQTDFCFSQSGGSSSPVTILIPVSVLNKSSLKPSFSESLSSELGGYM